MSSTWWHIGMYLAPIESATVLTTSETAIRDHKSAPIPNNRKLIGSPTEIWTPSLTQTDCVNDAPPTANVTEVSNNDGPLPMQAEEWKIKHDHTYVIFPTYEDDNFNATSIPTSTTWGRSYKHYIMTMLIVLVMMRVAVIMLMMMMKTWTPVGNYLMITIYHPTTNLRGTPTLLTVKKNFLFLICVFLQCWRGALSVEMSLHNMTGKQLVACYQFSLHTTVIIWLIGIHSQWSKENP